jgi:hypothetical protein
MLGVSAMGDRKGMKGHRIFEESSHRDHRSALLSTRMADRWTACYCSKGTIQRAQKMEMSMKQNLSVHKEGRNVLLLVRNNLWMSSVLSGDGFEDGLVRESAGLLLDVVGV